MNKIGLVFGVSAVSALVGCLDPNYVGTRQPTTVTTTPKAPTTVVQPPVDVPPVTPVEPAPTISETTTPVVVTPVVPVVPTTPVATAPETTTYIIQPGDSLSKISKKFNIKVDAIRKANPQIKNDIVRLGTKIKLPGKVEVGEQTVPVGAIARPVAPKAPAPATEYKGPTTEYVVKSGDVLGGIAIRHGMTLAQLKNLNGLTKNDIRVGQKLKVASGKTTAVASTPTTPTTGKTASVPAVEPKVNPTVAPAQADEPVVPPPEVTEPAPVVEPEPAQDEYVIYTVQEGEDITTVSIQTYVSPSEIRSLNNLSEDAQLKPGMKLKLPASSMQ